MGSDTVTLTSIHDLIKQLRLSESDSGSPGAGADHTSCNSSSVIIEGKIWLA